MRRRGGSYLAMAAVGIGAIALSMASRRVPSSGRLREPLGAPKSARTRMLEAGATALQGSGPLDDFDVYMVGFHPMKDNPQHQCEAHHFCRQVTEDFAECALFDGNTKDANLIGIEYIVSERIFEKLPREERKYWHPHNGEILSGQLIAPGLPEAAEHALMESKMNSYGKTWHLWDTGNREQPGDALPLGEARLMWSFSRLGEAREWLIRQRDQRMGTDTQALRRARADLVPLARPQEGVNALKGRFPRPTQDIPGVTEKKTRVTA